MPALLQLLAAWLPRTECRPFGLIGSAVNVGTAVAVAATAALAHRLGGDSGAWSMAFYGPAVLGATLAVGWLFLVFDAPGNHPRIAVAERQFVEARLATVVPVRSDGSAVRVGT